MDPVASEVFEAGLLVLLESQVGEVFSVVIIFEVVVGFIIRLKSHRHHRKQAFWF